MKRLLCAMLPAVALMMPLYARAAAGEPAPRWEPVKDFAAQIEADWLRQDATGRSFMEDSPGPVATDEDARGACDGIKNGLWGFHTGGGEQPWWQVDLGKPQSIARVLIYNRCDAGPERTANLILSLSDDATTWRECYKHNGTVFYGAPDGKPLAVALNGAAGRYVRIALPSAGYMYLDEVEVYGAADEKTNLALGRPANQSSTSLWSTKKALVNAQFPFDKVIERGRLLAADLRAAGVEADAGLKELDSHAAAWKALPANASPAARRTVYLKARWAVRGLALQNPLLDFATVLFVKRVPGSFSHMSDQNYGWWSQPGGGICLLRGFRTAKPEVMCLTPQFAPGSFQDPDLSYDGRSILFAWCKYYPGLAGERDKVDKSRIADDAFFHVYEMNIDGTGVRQITRGKYDDFGPRYLPSGDIVFLSTRRGQSLQCGKASAQAAGQGELPDSYVRCGGDHARPVAVYTLHVMDAGGGNVRAISGFENFEWTPNVADDGRILFARWDYVDRHNNAFMSLWSTNPDGTNLQIVYKNFTRSPQCAFEARPIPRSRKLVFTASAHHAFTAGSLCVLDPNGGVDGQQILTRLTPEVCFPEIDGWPGTYYCNPWPLSERYVLAAWSPHPINGQGSQVQGLALGVYLYDAFGNLELLHRDPAITSQWPIPLRPRPKPPVRASTVAWDGPQEGKLLLLNVYNGLDGIAAGSVKRLRIVGVPAKTQPEMNTPSIGVTAEDPGKCVLGTVPVEADGSAFFRMPSGTNVFFQALDKDGLAVQTMRTVTYVQPKQTLSCIGCHEPRNTAPPATRPVAVSRPPSKIKLGPDGSWPLRFDTLVQPVLDKHCVTCHQPGGNAQALAKLDLTPARSYDSLLAYGNLRQQVVNKYLAGRSQAGKGVAAESLLLAHLRKGHQNVKLEPEGLDRLATWLDTYAQRLGSFSTEQEKQLGDLKNAWADMLEK